MTSDVVDRAYRVERGWPVWAPPAVALGAWQQLQDALAAARQGPPCEADPEAWFAGVQSPLVEEAVAGCLSCQVVAECRAYAIAAGEAEGVWGGLTPAERRRAAGGGSR